jgi:hypothetical protein
MRKIVYQHLIPILRLKAMAAVMLAILAVVVRPGAASAGAVAVEVVLPTQKELPAEQKWKLVSMPMVMVNLMTKSALQ